MAEPIKQPNSWTCGPTALYNAMLTYGERADLRALITAADATRDLGSDEYKLADAAKEFGFKLDHVIARTAGEAYEMVRGYLREQTPVLACINHFDHWITVTRATSRHVWVYDSGGEQPEVFQRWTWRVFLRHAVYGFEDGMKFHFFPLKVAP